MKSGSLLAKDATFYVKEGLSGNDTYSFQCFNFKTHYLRHAGGRFRMAKQQESALYKLDASWKVVDAVKTTPEPTTPTLTPALETPTWDPDMTKAGVTLICKANNLFITADGPKLASVSWREVKASEYSILKSAVSNAYLLQSANFDAPENKCINLFKNNDDINQVVNHAKQADEPRQQFTFVQVPGEQGVYWVVSLINSEKNRVLGNNNGKLILTGKSECDDNQKWKVGSAADPVEKDPLDGRLCTVISELGNKFIHTEPVAKPFGKLPREAGTSEWVIRKGAHAKYLICSKKQEDMCLAVHNEVKLGQLVFLNKTGGAVKPDGKSSGLPKQLWYFEVDTGWFF